MTERIILAIYLWAIIFAFTSMLSSGYYTGELRDFVLYMSSSELMIILFCQFIGFISVYYIYNLSKNIRLNLGGYKFKVYAGKFMAFFSTICIANIFFVIDTGVGIVNSNKESQFSFIFAILNPDYLFQIYYLLCKDFYLDKKNNKYKWLFYLGVILYSTLKLSQGWTGFILIICFLEMYFYFKNKKINDVYKLLIPALLPFLLLILGGKLYQHLYQFKNEVRGNEFAPLEYHDGVDALANRLTFFPIAVGSIERINKINELYDSDSINYKELKGFLRPILPSFIVGDKNFRPLNNNAIQSFYPELENNTSADIGLISYSLVLFYINPIEGCIWLLFSVILIFFFKILFGAIEAYPGQLNILYFLLLVRFYYSASLEVVFSYGYIGLLYSIFIMICFGVVQIKKKKHFSIRYFR